MLTCTSSNASGGPYTSASFEKNEFVVPSVRSGKYQREMQQQRRRQQPRHDIRPINFLIERVQLAAVMERIQNERHQAENIKMHRARRIPPPHKNK